MPEKDLAFESGLIGREAELARLKNILNSTLQSKGKTVLVIGPANIGKQDLIETFIQRVSNEIRVYRGICPDYTPAPPYAPLRECFSDFFSEFFADNRRRFESIIPPPTDKGILAKATTRLFHHRTPALFRYAAPHTLFYKFLSALLENRGPTILVLEQIQRADPSTLALMRFLSNAIAEKSILILLTADALPISSASETEQTSKHEPETFNEIAQSLARQGILEEIHIAPFPEHKMLKLLECLIPDSQLPESLVNRILKFAKGNPFYLTQLLAYLVANGSIVIVNKTWKPNVCADLINIPDYIWPVVEKNLQLYDNESLYILHQAAVIGKVVNVSLLEETVSLPKREVSKKIEHLIKTGVFRYVRDGVLEFINSIQREAILRNSDTKNLSKYHAQVAAVISKKTDYFCERLAFHYDKGEVYLEAAKALLTAGSEAEYFLSFKEAYSFYARAASLFPKIREEFSDILEKLSLGFEEELFGDMLYLCRAILTLDDGKKCLDSKDKTLISNMATRKQAHLIFPHISRLIEYMREIISLGFKGSHLSEMEFFVDILTKKLLPRLDYANQAYYFALLGEAGRIFNNQRVALHYLTASSLYEKVAKQYGKVKTTEDFKNVYKAYRKGAFSALACREPVKALEYFKIQNELCQEHKGFDQIIEKLQAESLKDIAYAYTIIISDVNQELYFDKAIEAYREAAKLRLKLQEASLLAVKLLEKAYKEAKEKNQSLTEIEEELKDARRRISRYEDHGFKAHALLLTDDSNIGSADLIGDVLMKEGISPELMINASGEDINTKRFEFLFIFGSLNSDKMDYYMKFFNPQPELANVYSQKIAGDYFIREAGNSRYFLFFGQDPVEVFYTTEAFRREGMIRRYMI